jgi:hypothetical protein
MLRFFRKTIVRNPPNRDSQAIFEDNISINSKRGSADEIWGNGLGVMVFDFGVCDGQLPVAQ